MNPLGIRRIRLVLLRGEDPLTLAAWYQDVLGLDSLAQPEGDTGNWPPQFQFIQGDTGLEFASGGTRRDPPATRDTTPMTPIFEVADLDAVDAALRSKQVHIVKEIFSVGGGRSRMLYAADPEGNLIAFQQMRA